VVVLWIIDLVSMIDREGLVWNGVGYDG
jgi:hypothetical protein